MGDPCRQENRLGHMEDELTDMVKELRDGQRHQTKLLEGIARQSVRLDNLEGTAHRHEESIKELFNRSREYDRLPGALAIRVLLVLATFGSAIVSGVVVFVLTHQ